MQRRPKLLWIPHVAWEHCVAQRSWRLVDALRERYEIHLVTWETPPLGCGSKTRYYLNPVNHFRSLRTFSREDDGLTIHHAAAPLPVLQRIRRGYPPSWTLMLSELSFQRSLRVLHQRWKFNAAVVAASHHVTGYPPRLDGVPILFDYVDTSPPHVEARYLGMANRVVTVSHYLADRVHQSGRKARVIPNGVDWNRFRHADGSRARAKWGLQGKRVVSLIGMTCSSRLYFLEALARLVPEFPDLVFVGAGGGPLADAIQRRCHKLGIPAVMTGWVDPVEVPDLFAATDIGLYPGDDNPYFDGACPLKVLEFTTARVPVVVNRCRELIDLGFPSLMIRPATVEAFEDGLRKTLQCPPTVFPNMFSYDWNQLGKAFGNEIDALLNRFRFVDAAYCHSS